MMKFATNATLGRVELDSERTFLAIGYGNTGKSAEGCDLRREACTVNQGGGGGSGTGI